MIQATYGTTITSSQINSAAAQILNAKLPNGQYLIPSAQYTPTQAVNAGLRCRRARPQYASHRKPGDRRHRLCFKLQGSLVREILHSEQSHQQSFWRGRFAARICPTAFRRQPGVFPLELRRALPQPHLGTACGFHSPASLCKHNKRIHPKFGGHYPAWLGDFSAVRHLHSRTLRSSAGLEFGPSTSFGDGGMFQNQWEYGTSVSWVKGKHILSVGTTWDHTQLNILNNNTNTDTLDFTDLR